VPEIEKPLIDVLHSFKDQRHSYPLRQMTPISAKLAEYQLTFCRLNAVMLISCDGRVTGFLVRRWAWPRRDQPVFW
jgi:hypothetical protein